MPKFRNKKRLICGACYLFEFARQEASRGNEILLSKSVVQSLISCIKQFLWLQNNII